MAAGEKGFTKIEDLIDPQVLQDMVSAKLPDAIVFAPLGDIDNTLQGRAGSTLTVPSYDYIGDAEDVAEGEAIPMSKLGTKEKSFTIKKAAKGVEITDEAILSAHGDPLGEIANQLVMSIANKVDNDVLKEAGTSTQKVTVEGMTVDSLDKIISVFNDEDDEDAPMVAIMNPADAATLRIDAGKNWLSATEVGANRVISGIFGEILGCQIKRSRKVKKGTAYVIKPGAFKILMKRDTLVESDRDIIKKTWFFTTDKHYGAYLYDSSKIVKATITDPAPETDPATETGK